MPERKTSQGLPEKEVGPYELRGETLAGALKLITSDQNIPIAFQTDKGLSTTVTVSELEGPMDTVINKICGLANLYCSFENGMLTVKETEVFTVTMPPIGSAEDGGGGGTGDDLSGDTGELLEQVSTAIEEITGNEPVVDESTRTMIYRATQRTSDIARRYFQRLRSQTAMVVYKVYIWEVSLNSSNQTGIDWNEITNIKEYDLNIDVPGGTSASQPISFSLETANEGAVFDFISDYGTVKTISQPRVAMLSGSQATLGINNVENFVSEISRTTDDDGDETFSSTTDSVESGFTLTISSNWDNSSIYSRLDLDFTNVQEIVEFDVGPDSTVQLPTVEERNIQTQIRMRPGDSMLIAGLVDEQDNLDKSGPGATSLFFPTSRSVSTANQELVILLEPRVVVFTENPASGHDKDRFAKAGTSQTEKAAIPGASSGIRSRKIGESQLSRQADAAHDRSNSMPEGKTAVERGEVEQRIEYDVFNPSPQ